MIKSLLKLLPLLFLTGCAGLSRDCSGAGAGAFGADWIIVQYKLDGTPINCWRLPNTSVTNEAHSDGIYWLAPSGHLVHISGWYNRVQVEGGGWEEAAKNLGVDLKYCKSGKYMLPAPASSSAPLVVALSSAVAVLVDECSACYGCPVVWNYIEDKTTYKMQRDPVSELAEQVIEMSPRTDFIEGIAFQKLNQCARLWNIIPIRFTRQYIHMVATYPGQPGVELRLWLEPRADLGPQPFWNRVG